MYVDLSLSLAFLSIVVHLSVVNQHTVTTKTNGMLTRPWNKLQAQQSLPERVTCKAPDVFEIQMTVQTHVYKVKPATPASVRF